MKFLVLSLLLFFLIGTHGNAIPQGTDPEPPRPGARESLKSLIHDVFVLGAELVGMIDSPDSDKMNHLQKRGESIFSYAYNMFYAMGIIVVDTYQEVDKEIHEKYPTYRTKVIPIVEQHVSNIIKYVMSLKDEILPHVKKANLEIMKIQIQLISDMKTLFEGHIDKLRSFREEMNTKIRPFVEQVQQEVEAGEKAESDKKQLTETQREVFKYLMKGTEAEHEESNKKALQLIELFTSGKA